MAWKIIQRFNTAHEIVVVFCDTEADVDNVPTRFGVGSKIVLANARQYRLNSKKEWVADSGEFTTDGLKEMLGYMPADEKQVIENTDGIKQLKEDLANKSIALVIKCDTEESEMLNIQDSADYPLQELHIYGKETKIENPTVKVCGKNLYNSSQLFKNIVLSINYNYTNTNIGYSAVTKDTKYFALGGYFKAGIYRVTCLSDSIYLSIDRIAIAGNSCIGCNVHLRNSYQWTQSIDGYTYFGFEVDASDKDYTDMPLGTNNIEDLKIMITSGTGIPSEYKPYQEPQTQQFNFTGYAIGDVRDELIVYADGTGQFIQRIDTKINTQTTTSDHSDCILENPIITELPAEQVTQFKSYYGTTNIFTDTNAELECKYVADTKLYVDKQINELARAIVASASEAE